MSITNGIDVAGLDEETDEEKVGGAGVVAKRLRILLQNDPVSMEADLQAIQNSD